MPLGTPFKPYEPSRYETELVDMYGGGDEGKRKLDELVLKYAYAADRDLSHPLAGTERRNVGFDEQSQAKINEEKLDFMSGLANFSEDLPEGYMFLKRLLTEKNVGSGPGLVNFGLEAANRISRAQAASDAHDERLKRIESFTYSPEEHAREMSRPAVWDQNRSPMPQRFSTPPQTKRYFVAPGIGSMPGMGGAGMPGTAPIRYSEDVHDRHEMWSRFVKPTLQAIPNTLFKASDWLHSQLPPSLGGAYDNETADQYEFRTGRIRDPYGMERAMTIKSGEGWRPYRPNDDDADRHEFMSKLYRQETEFRNQARRNTAMNKF